MTRLIDMYALDFWYESDDEDPDSTYTLIGDDTGDYVIAADGILGHDEVWSIAEAHNEQVKAEFQRS